MARAHAPLPMQARVLAPAWGDFRSSCCPDSTDGSEIESPAASAGAEPIAARVAIGLGSLTFPPAHAGAHREALARASRHLAPSSNSRVRQGRLVYRRRPGTNAPTPARDRPDTPDHAHLRGIASGVLDIRAARTRDTHALQRPRPRRTSTA